MLRSYRSGGASVAERPQEPRFSRLFTHEEATGLLPELRPRLQNLAAMKRRLDAVQREFAEIRKHAQSNGHGKRAQELAKELDALVHDLNTDIAGIHALGIEVKDL